MTLQWLTWLPPSQDLETPQRYIFGCVMRMFPLVVAQSTMMASPTVSVWHGKPGRVAALYCRWGSKRNWILCSIEVGKANSNRCSQEEVETAPIIPPFSTVFTLGMPFGCPVGGQVITYSHTGKHLHIHFQKVYLLGYCDSHLLGYGDSHQPDSHDESTIA